MINYWNSSIDCNLKKKIDSPRWDLTQLSDMMLLSLS